MTHAMYGTPRGDWRITTSESFGLTPVQLATLCAIVAFWKVEGDPMPSTELRRFETKPECEGQYSIDAGCVSYLVRLALVERLGSQTDRYWRPTRAGIGRLGQ